MDYLFHLLVLCSIYSVLAASANLNLGWSGLFNVAIAAFFGLGAYTAALIPPGHSALYVGSTIILCGLIPLCVSLVISLTLRVLRGDYFALATLAFGVAFVSLLRNTVREIFGVEKPTVFFTVVPNHDVFPFFVLLIAIGLIWIIHRITSSVIGAALISQSHNPAPLAAMGYNVFALRAVSLACSAFCAGIVGCLYAWHLGIAVPSSFSIGQAFTVISMALIGGVSTPWGAPLGALAILMIPEMLNWLNPGGIDVQIVSEMIAAALIIIVILLRKVLENKPQYD